MLIGGGAMVAIGFSMLGYYSMQFVNSIQEDEKLRVEPGGSLEIKQNINASQGTYVVIFPDFEGRPTVTINDPSGHPVIKRAIEPPIVLESFTVVQPGVYTLSISNPTDQVLEPFIVLGDQDTVFSQGIDFSATATAIAFTSLLGVGVALAIAGAVITVLDRRRISKMKQFGDTSDLV
jgi:hypothetical protein